MSRSIEQDGRDQEYRTRSRNGFPRVPQATPRDPSAERHNEMSARLRDTIDRASQGNPTMSELIERLENFGIRAVPSLQKSGRLNGMSYEVDGVRIKGSDLGRPYTALGLRNRKGVRYDQEGDSQRIQEAMRHAREHPTPLERLRPVTRDREGRRRDYDGLSPAQLAAMREIGRFRTVLVDDFVRLQYRGDRAAWRQDLARLASQKFIEQRSMVITTHSKAQGRATRSLSVVVLTKKGKDLLRRCDKNAKAARQAFYAGFVKPREVAHDAAIYRLYQAEAAHIEGEGGRVKRVVLDFELKKRVYSPLAKARGVSEAEYSRKQADVAQENGLKVVQGKIRFPDLRIEYETARGEAARVDLELATEHYRGDHMAAKDRAGFKIYADSASFPPGGSYGGSSVFDDHEIEIFSF